MAKLLKLRRGSTTQHASFTGAEGEVTIDTTKDTAVIHDGAQAGGRPLLREDMDNLPAGTIDNADINASAAIAGTKISPDFGSQNIDTTGHLASGQVNITGTAPRVRLIDSDDNPDYSLRNNNGTFEIFDENAPNSRITVDSSKIVSKLNHDFDAGIDVTGNITATGDIRVPDDKSVFCGGSDDFAMLHRSSDNASILKESGGGDLSLETNGSKVGIYDNANNRVMAEFLTGGACNFKHGATTRLETTSSGATVTGNLTTTGHFDVATHGELTFKAGATNAVVSGLTGHVLQNSLHLRADQDIWLSSTSGKKITFGTSDGAPHEVMRVQCAAVGASQHGFVNLNYVTANAGGNASSATKLSTTSAGIDVTGNITVSGTVDGRDIAADGTKLDGIETGATADQTASDILGLITGSNIYTSGNIGRDSNDHIVFTDDSRLDVVIAGNNEFRFEADGDFHADGDVIAYSTTTASDEKLKENIEIVSDPIEKVEALRGVTFDWKKDGTSSAGVIAQDVMKVLPEAVKEVQGLNDNESHLAVNYHALTSILIESVKELSARVKELEAK